MTSIGASALDAHDADPLGALHLAPCDRLALARQGFVATEFRDTRGPYFKLRWRRGGRQRVRYLGSDPARAEKVRAALEDLQRPRRTARELARLMAEARRRLLQARRAVDPHAAARGLHYHGYTLRRPLAPPAAEARARRPAPS